MVRYYFFLLSLILVAGVSAKTPRIKKVMFYNKTYGHIHKNPSRYSQSLSTIACNHPVKVLSKPKTSKKEFHFVKVGLYKGYIHKDYLSSRKARCIQDKYPRFFDQLNLSISDKYYWGKLYDQYVKGRSQVK